MVGIDAVKLIEWPRYSDQRGYFAETFKPSYLEGVFLQDNESESSKGVIRGLHYQPGMGKLMRVVRGSAYLVALDLRRYSITFGEHVGVVLTEQDPAALWAPAEFARGFQALTDNTKICYKCTAVYSQKDEGAIRWDSAGIVWPLSPTIISAKDREAPTLDDYRRNPKFF